MYIIRAEIKRYLDKSILLSFCLLVLLTAAAGLFGERLLARDGLFPPFLVYVVDGDQSQESALLTESLEGYKSQSMRVLAADEQTALAAVESGAAAGAVLIPKGFFADILSGENSDAALVVNQENPAVAAVLTLFARAMQEELAAAQSGIYSILSYAQSGQQRQSYTTEANIIFFSMFAGRNMSEETVDLFGTVSYRDYYSLSFAVFMLLMLSALFIQKGNKIKGAEMAAILRTKGMGRSRLFACKLLSVAAVYGLLNLPVMLFLYLGGVFAGMSAAKVCLLYGLMVLWAAVFCNFFIWAFASVRTAGVAVFAAGLLLQFFSGGLIPLALMPGALKKFAPFTPNYHLMEVFLSAKMGQKTGLSVAAVLLSAAVVLCAAYALAWRQERRGA